MSTSAEVLAPTAVDDEAVRRLVPVGTLPSAMRTALTADAMVYDLHAGGRLDGGAPSLAESLFLVSGSVELHAPDESPVTLCAGADDGCHALYGLSRPGAHLVAREPARLLQVDRALLSALLICVAAGDDLADAPWLPRLLATDPFSHLPPSGLHDLGAQLQRVELPGNEVVVRQGERAEYYYLLSSGRCVIEWQQGDGAEAVALARVAPGDGFGEEALIGDLTRTASVRTLEPSVLLRLTREQLETLMTVPSLPRCSRDEAAERIAAGAFWLDVRLPEEHAHHAPEGSINMPLGALRAGMEWLEKDSQWLVCCNAGRRSEAAVAMLAAHGFDVWLLDGGLFGQAGVPDRRSDLGNLQVLRVQADAELETALRESAAAEAAVAAVRQADPREMERAASLREAATRSRANLDAALRRKLELDQQWRDLEAEVRARHERARAECLRLRNETEERLRSERERLSSEASEAARAMQSLRAERKRAEARFAEEQRQLNERMQRERQDLEAQARRIREEMQRARQATEENLRRIRSEQGASERQLVRDAEARLASERRRLQAEIGVCLQAQAEARAELEEVEAAQQEAARAAEQARRRLHAESEHARHERDAVARAERDRLAAAAREAQQRLAEAERVSAETRARREDLEHSVTALTETGEPQTAEEPAALSLRAELAVYESEAEGAARQVAEALQAREAAERAQLDAETRAARTQASEEELRLRLLEELEEALLAEQGDTAAPVATVGAPAPSMESARKGKGVFALHDRREQVGDDDAPLSPDLIADIQFQLENDARGDELRQRIEAERSRLTRKAVTAAGEEKRRAHEALERARRHLATLSARGGGNG